MNAEVIVTEQELPPEVIEAIRQGRKVEAIKILREAKGLGLANAKVLVDRAWRTHGPVREMPSFADHPQGLSVIGKLLALALFVIAAWYFYTSR
jgi:hypothetical protein